MPVIIARPKSVGTMARSLHVRAVSPGRISRRMSGDHARMAVAPSSPGGRGSSPRRHISNPATECIASLTPIAVTPTYPRRRVRNAFVAATDLVVAAVTNIATPTHPESIVAIPIAPRSPIEGSLGALSTNCNHPTPTPTRIPRRNPIPAACCRLRDRSCVAAKSPTREAHKSGVFVIGQSNRITSGGQPVATRRSRTNRGRNWHATRARHGAKRRCR